MQPSKSDNWHRIPLELQALEAWCIASPNKAPFTVHGEGASSTDSSTWTDFYTVTHTAQSWGDAGVGFMLHEESGLTCIDIDVKDDTPPEALARFEKIIASFDSYTERSASGRGFHIWVRGSIGQGCRRDGVEVYSQERFMICTGDVYLDKPIASRPDMLALLVEEMRRAAGGAPSNFDLKEADAEREDNEIWQVATTAANSDKFLKLWHGQWQGEREYPSQSEADLSLLSMLCFYSKSNAQVRRMFRYSALGKREKATKDDRYLDRTLKVIRARQEREAHLVAIGRANSESMVQKAQERAEVEKATGVAPPLAPVAVVPDLPTVAVGIDWPPGVLGELARWFYACAPRPVKEVAIVSALGVVSGIYGRAYNVSNSGLNLYIVLVARSAIGKEAMHSGISKLVHTMLSSGFTQFSEFIDFSDYASGPALIKSLAKRSSFVNIAGEWGRKLRKMSDDSAEGPMSSLRTVMTNLYQKSSSNTIVGGIGYSDKEKDVKSVNGVAYSMIGETTPDTFYESLTNSMMADGFMSRFIVLEHTGIRPAFNYQQDNPLPANVFNSLGNGYTCAASCMPGTHYEVKLSDEAARMLRDFDLQCDEQINATPVESWRQMWNRAHLKALKISALLAVCDNPSAPLVQPHHAQWALALVQHDIGVMSRKMRDGDVGDGDNVREAKLLSILLRYLQTPIPAGYKMSDVMRQNGVVTKKYLQMRTSDSNPFIKHKLGAVRALELTIQSLIDNGYLEEVPKLHVPVEWQFRGKCYRILSLPDV